MVKQSNVVLLSFEVIAILLILSSCLTLVVYLTSSEATKIGKIPTNSPYTLLNISPQSNEIVFPASNRIGVEQSFNSLEEISVGKSFVDIAKDGDYTVVLIDQGDTILEIVSDDSGTRQYLLTPVCLGEVRFEELSPETTDVEAGVALYRIELTLPDEGSSPELKYVDIFDVWCENGWHSWGSTNLLHTEGRFYVDYGRAVLHVTDRSYAVTPTGFYQHQDCHSEVGHSNIAGWVTNNDIWSLYNLPTNAKFSVDSWITVDMYGNVQLGTSSDKWLSLSFLPGVNRSSTSGTVGSLLEGPR